MSNSSKSRRSVTMRDVAKLAGVSQPTVSRVLNQSDTAISISEETRSRVLAAVQELNYRPNMLARGLRTQQTLMIAIMIADISNSFYHPIVRSIQDYATNYGYDVMIANTDHLQIHEYQFCEAVTRRPVDGVIMVPLHLSTEELVDFTNRTDTPVAVLGPQFDHPQFDVVYLKDRLAVYEATRWLIEERGHRRLGFMGVPDDLPPGPRRLDGFLQALDEANLTLAPEHHVQGDFSMESGRTAARQLLQTGGMPSVVVALNDLMAVGAILAFQEAGYAVPDDIAVIGFDNISEGTIVRPRLTTIAQDPVDIGRKLAECLFTRIEDPSVPGRRLESPSRLIVREST